MHDSFPRIPRELFLVEESLGSIEVFAYDRAVFGMAPDKAAQEEEEDEDEDCC